MCISDAAGASAAAAAGSACFTRRPLDATLEARGHCYPGKVCLAWSCANDVFEINVNAHIKIIKFFILNPF